MLNNDLLCIKMDWTLFDNMVDTRMLLECECTRLALKNATDEDFRQIETVLKTMERHKDMDSFIEGNFAFHYALASISGNAVYAMIFDSFSNAIHFFFKIYFTSNERRDISIGQHQQLYKALCERDEAAALDSIKHTGYRGSRKGV